MILVTPVGQRRKNIPSLVSPFIDNLHRLGNSLSHPGLVSPFISGYHEVVVAATTRLCRSGCEKWQELILLLCGGFRGCRSQPLTLWLNGDIITKYEAEKEMLFVRYEQLRKEKTMLSENEKSSAARIVQLEESLKKKKQDDKTFSILRKILGSFLGNASDEDFPLNE